MPSEPSSTPNPDPTPSPNEQRDALLDSERAANRDQPRNFRDKAIEEKVVRVEPDGTGPSPMDSLDPKPK